MEFASMGRFIYDEKLFWRVFASIRHAKIIFFPLYKYMSVKGINIGDALEGSKFSHIRFSLWDKYTEDLPDTSDESISNIFAVLGRCPKVIENLKTVEFYNFDFKETFKENILKKNGFSDVEAVRRKI
jgi:hypothetical protein